MFCSDIFLPSLDLWYFLPMDSGSAIQVCVYCQQFEIPAPGTEWGDFDPVTSGNFWLVSAGF